MELDMGGIFGSLAGKGLNVVYILVSVVVAGAFIAAIIHLYKNWKRYQEYQVVIWEKDGFGQLTHSYDNAGIFVDKNTQNKRLFLQKNRVGLEPDNIPFLLKPDGKKVVLVLKTGLKNFAYIKPIIDGGLIKFNVGEEDVNWALNAYESQKKRFANNFLKEYMPFIILGLGFLIMLILFISILNKMSLFLDIARELKAVAELLVQARAGTTVIS